MNSTPTTADPRRVARRGRQGWAVAALLAAAILLTPVAYRFAYRERLYPGVQVNGLPVGGLRPVEALAHLEAAGLRPEAPVTLTAGDRRWPLAPGQSGLALDLRATVAEAYAVGRSGSGPAAFGAMLASRLRGRSLAAIVTLDEIQARAALAELAATFDRPPEDAGLRVSAGTVEPVPSVTGLALDKAAALDTLREAASAGLWPVRGLALPYRETRPAVTDASAVVADARALLARPVTLRSGELTWSLPPERLATMLRVVKTGADIRLDVARDAFREWLTPVTQAISRTAEAPRFHFDVEAQRLQLIRPGLAGARVNVERTTERLLSAADTDHAVTVATDTLAPPVSDQVSAAELGIRELVTSQTSRYAGSPAERIHNVGVAAARFDGLLIPPDAVFSFNEHLGDVSEAEGYKKSKIIMDGATRDGVGGGVCQVSTTLFRAAFFAGLPIVERQAHGYRVGYYEQGSKPGLDATIYSPVVDLKFANDTGHWLLVEALPNARRTTLTFRFFGTKPPGRSVRMEGPFESGRTPPPAARVELDPTLAPGTSVNVEASRWGGTYRVVRIVADGDQERREDYVSHYRPTGAITQVGPQPEVAAAPVTPGPPAP